MILKYYQNHKSIEFPFEDLSLGNFTVLTGKNGSGKTHLLTALRDGKIWVEGISPKNILYLSYTDFSQNFQTITDRIEPINSWNRFINEHDILGQLKIRCNNMLPYADIIERSAALANKSIYSLSIEDLKTEKEDDKKNIFETILSVNQDIDRTANQDNFKDDFVFQSVIESVFKQTKLLPPKLRDIDFYGLYQKTIFGNSKILSDLSQIFFEYYKNIDRNDRKERKGKDHLSQEQFEKEYGPKPWDLIRNILNGFGLHFDINDPEQDDIDPIDGSFGIKFINKNRNDKEVKFEDLSSGEQILITLINAIFTAGKRAGLPKLLLLDEIDSPLNPSIIDKFIDYILENFVGNGINVIIATHSPSTVAFSPENSVYIVNTKQSPPIVSTGINQAIHKLTEGFLTLSDVINFEKIPQSKIIISEGKNHNYLIRAKQIFAQDNDDLAIININVGGTSQVRTLFEFMRNFNTSKTFIFVFDCDYKYKEVREKNGAFVKNEAGIQEYEPRDLEQIKRNANSNNRFFIFPENQNSQSTRGIENIFDKDSTSSYPGKFDEKTPKNKSGFEKYILQRKIDEDFRNFKQLFDFINGSDVTNF